MDSSYHEVVYRNTTLDKGDAFLSLIEITDRRKATVLSTVSARARSAPYVVQAGEFWFFADNPLSYPGRADRYLVFADLLHDIVQENHPASHSAVIRIADVNALSNPEDLTAIGDLLNSAQVPFLVSLTPFSIDPADGSTVSLSDKPAVGAALKYMISRGGTIVLNGSTHTHSAGQRDSTPSSGISPETARLRTTEEGWYGTRSTSPSTKSSRWGSIPCCGKRRTLRPVHSPIR